jgi:hypothetical protein
MLSYLSTRTALSLPFTSVYNLFPYPGFILFLLHSFLPVFLSIVLFLNVYRLLVGKPEGKRPPGRPRRRWLDNIKMDLLDIGLSVVDWIGLAQDKCMWGALVNSVMNFRAP